MAQAFSEKKLSLIVLMGMFNLYVVIITGI